MSPLDEAIDGALKRQFFTLNKIYLQRRLYVTLGLLLMYIIPRRLDDPPDVAVPSKAVPAMSVQPGAVSKVRRPACLPEARRVWCDYRGGPPMQSPRTNATAAVSSFAYRGACPGKLCRSLDSAQPADRYGPIDAPLGQVSTLLSYRNRSVITSITQLTAYSPVNL